MNEPMLHLPLAAVNDAEGDRVPEGLPVVVDAHVHVFPDGIFTAIREWFDHYAWPVRYRMSAHRVLDYLLSRGVGHVVALQYAHKPGIAADLNRFMASLVSAFAGQVTGMATVFPGEPRAGRILSDAFDMGLAGVKLHAHVQCFDMESDAMVEIYEACTAAGKPLVMHVGREPKSPAYPCDPYAICSAGKLEQVILQYPSLKVCVPHLGGDEFVAYHRLLQRYDNLWLDTAMVVTDYLPMENPVPLETMRLDRIMYGSDFPNIPYAWDRELKQLAGDGRLAPSFEKIFGGNAAEFFSIPLSGAIAG